MTPDDLTKWRDARLVTQRTLATVLDVSRRTVLRWEAGQTPIPPDTLERLAALEDRFQPRGKRPPKTTSDPPGAVYSDIFCNVAMPGVEVPHGFPKQRVEWFEKHCLRALAATYVTGIGMVDDKPDGFGPACSPWFYTRGTMPAFVRDNVEAIRAMQADGTTPEELLAELREMPRWNGKPEKSIKTTKTT